MSFVLVHRPGSMHTAKYDEIVRRLEDSGAGAPPGRLYHVCFGSTDGLSVVDIWESRATFDGFAHLLLPILEQVGVDPGHIEFEPVYNEIVGAATGAV
ncbi:MAG: hypothetical protein J2P45_11380 [Candidatus Dormibacteraeota bacterium]|nr:hypothetical protein [Candidatus Dormibacteraeota bacterium]